MGTRDVLVLTFDNLGEASALERGASDPGVPLGRDPSVTRALPRLLDELDRHDLRATFFVEAINCELNPEAVRAIAERGHELGVHGWSHEPWAELDAGAERDLLDRCTAAFAALSLHAPAFRPPGGGLTGRTEGLLRARGYTWCSPEGDLPAVHDGLAVIPFTWELVDAFHLMERFAPLRRRHGAPAAPVDPSVLSESLERRLVDGVRRAPGGVQTLILHPFLMLDEVWWEGARRLLATAARWRADGGVEVLPGGELAARLRGVA